MNQPIETFHATHVWVYSAQCRNDGYDVAMVTIVRLKSDMPLSGQLQ